MKLTALAAILAMMQQSPYGEVIEVRRHNVDVIVTDAQGKHVGGLTAADFEVLEDGKKQSITNFAEYDDRASIAAAPRATTDAAPAAVAQVPPPRKFVVFVDEMTIHPYTRKKFSNSVSDLVERAMRDGDEAAVVRPVSANKVALTFTTDRAVVRQDVAAAMDASRFRTDSALANEQRLYSSECGGNMGTSRAGELQAARCYARRIRQRVEQRLGNLRALVSALAGQPGRKVIVLVTESLPARPGEELFRFAQRADFHPTVAKVSLDAPDSANSADYVDLTPMIEEIARSASANGITIYSLQPDFGITAPAPGGIEAGMRTRDPIPDPVPSASQPLGRNLENSSDAATFSAMQAIYNTEATMDVLAGRTGGKWFRGDTSVDDAFRQVQLDVQSYYSIAYRAESALDRPHRVEVRVRNRPELNVRTRNEVTRRSIRNEITERVVASLVEPDAQNELGIAVRAADIHRDRRTATAKIDVIVPLGNLMFQRDGDVQRARFTVHYAISGEQIDFRSGVEPEQVVEIPAAEWDEARAKHWRYTLTMNLRKGAHRVGVGVLDGVSQEWGVATVDVDTR